MWIGFAAVAAGAYAAVLALLWAAQERLIFMPQPLPAAHRFAFGPDVHETWVDVPGARLHALHLQLPAPAGLVFFLHGNAGNLDGWFADVGFYRRAGHDLFMPDYRGYGKSSGRIDSEAQLHADVRAAWASEAERQLIAADARRVGVRARGTNVTRRCCAGDVAATGSCALRSA
ncbi:alpha/beta fold hydrolase [Azohydromonas sediminis]|uniref:alpha/beta fold hydrolase n=1 Tax=Azohydromonas sediminis TaxID=2259674 RepID=UPI0013C350A9|nr:alpha/beta fold hydrolase [Azohydromonas sediminis]